MNKYLDISPEVQQALADGKPVVALESTIISHGMPYPKNVETAMLVEKTIRENGAVPATIAIIGGRLKAGLSPEEIEYLGKSGRKVAKVSRRDLAAIVASGADGATTVTTTMIIAHMAGILTSAIQAADRLELDALKGPALADVDLDLVRDIKRDCSICINLLEQIGRERR
jgi:pseudouridine-5'-phosphate glycosidase